MGSFFLFIFFTTFSCGKKIWYFNWKKSRPYLSTALIEIILTKIQINQFEFGLLYHLQLCISWVEGVMLQVRFDLKLGWVNMLGFSNKKKKKKNAWVWVSRGCIDEPYSEFSRCILIQGRFFSYFIFGQFLDWTNDNI